LERGRENPPVLPLAPTLKFSVGVKKRLKTEGF